MRTIDVWRIVTIPEACKRANIDHDTMRQWLHRYEDFPRPFLTFSKTIKLYDYLAISEWIRANAPYGYVPMKESTKDKLRQAAAEQHRDRLGWFLPTDRT